MDFRSFQAQLEAARTFEVELEGARFKLLLPTEHACRVAIEANRDAHGEVIGARSSRQILDAAVIGWDGVKASHFKPDAGEETIAFSAAARASFLDNRVDLGMQMMVALAERIEARRAQREASRKN
jgi:hypothetical protein